MKTLTYTPPGFCVACGQIVNDVDPDTRKRLCEACYEYAVYGVGEIHMMLRAPADAGARSAPRPRRTSADR